MKGQLVAGDTEEQENETSLEIEDKEQNADFQRYATSVRDVLRINFRIHLCAWDEIQNKNDMNSKVFEGMTIMDRHFARRKGSDVMRKCNEVCSDMLSSSLYGLINQSSLLSNVSDMQIYKMWSGYKHDIRMDLLKNVYLRHNAYQIKDGEINSINAYHTSWMLAAYMAKGGATMKAFTEQVMSVFNTQLRNGLPMPQQSNGIGDKLGNLLKVKHA